MAVLKQPSQSLHLLLPLEAHTAVNKVRFNDVSLLGCAWKFLRAGEVFDAQFLQFDASVPDIARNSKAALPYIRALPLKQSGRSSRQTLALPITVFVVVPLDGTYYKNLSIWNQRVYLSKELGGR